MGAQEFSFATTFRGIFSPKFCRFLRKFSDKHKIFHDWLKFSVGEATAP